MTESKLESFVNVNNCIIICPGMFINSGLLLLSPQLTDLMGVKKWELQQLVESWHRKNISRPELLKRIGIFLKFNGLQNLLKEKSVLIDSRMDRFGNRVLKEGFGDVKIKFNEGIKKEEKVSVLKDREKITKNQEYVDQYQMIKKEYIEDNYKVKSEIMEKVLKGELSKDNCDTKKEYIETEDEGEYIEYDDDLKSEEKEFKEEFIQEAYNEVDSEDMQEKEVVMSDVPNGSILQNSIPQNPGPLSQTSISLPLPSSTEYSSSFRRVQPFSSPRQQNQVLSGDVDRKRREEERWESHSGDESLQREESLSGEENLRVGNSLPMEHLLLREDSYCGSTSLEESVSPDESPLIDVSLPCVAKTRLNPNISGSKMNLFSENSDLSLQSNKAKTDYSFSEEKLLVNYFLEQGMYSRRRGNLVWKIMEKESVCVGRTWQSMKNRFLKKTIFKLSMFGTTKGKLMKADNLNKTSEKSLLNGDKDEYLNSSNLVPRWKTTYSKEEGQRILDYIVKNHRYEDVGGVVLWRLMEEITEGGRSWQSMKERFRKNIIKNMKSKSNYYDLTKDQRKRFLCS